jgi:hypothetical protein
VKTVTEQLAGLCRAPVLLTLPISTRLSSGISKISFPLLERLVLSGISSFTID